MYGLTRGTITLLGAALAGFLIWLASQVDAGTTGGYWSAYGLLAAAGLDDGLLAGYSWRMDQVGLAAPVARTAPARVRPGAHRRGLGARRRTTTRQLVPESRWELARQDISIDSLVRDLTQYAAVLGFGIGLVFGFTFDTSATTADGRLVGVGAQFDSRRRSRSSAVARAKRRRWSPGPRARARRGRRSVGPARL